MQRPDFELRTAILLIKAQERNISIDMNAAQKLAQDIRDTRELEGALLKMMSLAVAENKDSITLESTQNELNKKQSLVAKRVQPQEVVKTVATFYNLKQADIKGPSRKQSIALARQVSMFLLRETFHLNYEDIASLLKRKDHTTVMHGVSKIKERVMKDPSFSENISSITSQLI
jgi:chromosomal replication initiator protein